MFALSLSVFQHMIKLSTLTNLAEQSTEDVERKLLRLIFEILGIERKIEIGNVHRFGKRYNDRPRPIVARFLYHKDLRMVLDQATWHKNTPFFNI
jgi:hypothetical protein